MTTNLRNYTALVFFTTLTFAFSWVMWWTPVPEYLGIDPVTAGLIGAFGPSLSGLLTVAAFAGRRGVTSMVARLKIWRIHPKWYVFVLFYPLALWLSLTVVHVIMGGSWPDYSTPLFVTEYPIPDEIKGSGFIYFIPIVFIQQTLIGSSMGEELGWRGFALSDMQKKWGATMASLILGLIWGIWHLPLALNPDDIRSQTPFLFTLLGTIASAVLFTWVYNHTRNSLFLALLFHTGLNMPYLFLALPDFNNYLVLVGSWLLPVFLIVYSRGRLGYHISEPESDLFDDFRVETTHTKHDLPV